MLSFRQHWFNSAVGRTIGVLVAVSTTLLNAIHPLTYGLLPVTPDGLLHLYRLIALDHAIRHGDWWPRYVPGFLFGYGAPVFNFYAPLSLYPMEGLHLLGLSFVDALILAMIGYTLVGAVGAYLFGKIWGGPVSGIVTAAAYAYAPYVLYDWPRRGAVAEFVALALLPWILWAFWRLAMQGQRRDLALATLFFGLLILTHNITALYVTPLLLAYSAFLWWTSADPPRAFVRLGLAFVLALGLTTFFWLPALVETRYVFIERVSYGVANLDFHNNFQSLADTLAAPLTADLTQLHPPVPRPLGWPQIGLAIAGALLLLWHGSRHRARVVSDPAEGTRLRGWLGVSLAGLVILVLLTTRASVWIWEIMPLMHFIQFPWRLLGPASLLLATLAGLGAALIARLIPWRAGRAAWIALSVGGLIVYGLPWLYGVYLPDPPARTIVDAQNFERETGWLAGTAAGEYVPIWTTELPDPGRLLGLYAQSEVIPRLQPTDDVEIEAMTWGAMSVVLDFNARRDTTLVFDWLYFPGWWARLDGRAVWIEPTSPQGFLSVEVEEGEHTLEIGFGPTPLRLGAMIASGVFLGILIGVLAPQRLWGQDNEEQLPGESIWPAVIGALAAGVIVFGAKALWIDHADTPIQRARFANGIDAGLETPIRADFNHEIVLLGYDLTPPQAASGSTLRLWLYWQLAGEEISTNYSSVIYLRDAAGNILVQTGSQHPGDLPTSDWVQNGFYVQERLAIQVPAGTPPGSYTLHAALYSHTAGRNLEIWDAAGVPVGVILPIGTVDIKRPVLRPSADALELSEKLDEPATNALTLVGVETLPAEIEVGQPFSLIWGWQATDSLVQDFGAQVVWLDEEDHAAAASPIIPLVTGYPTDQWEPGDIWKGIHVLYVPGRLERGEYDAAVRLYDAAGRQVGQDVILGKMQVITPPRSFDVPDVESETEIDWANGIRLIGYDAGQRRVRPGEAVNVSLYWQPQTDVTVSLTLFMHLVDEAGNIIAQQDQIPVLGARPTTGWAPGEAIRNPIQLFIPQNVLAGEYNVRIGWYNAATGERIPLTNGDDSLTLPELIRVLEWDQ